MKFTSYVWRLSLNKERWHVWEKGVFDKKTGRPVAICKDTLQLYPRNPAFMDNFNELAETIPDCKDCKKFWEKE